jgi:pyrimidine-nucleoside phosphorylase
LGFSGGTLDKLESIPGFRIDLTKDEFLSQLGSIGMVLSGQSVDLAPADGKLYALRDVTGTVQSTPLIASSIMSKKIAAGAQAIVLDVKIGQGAFMTTLEDARELASLMVSIGELSGRDVTAVLSDMNQPLGEAVGHALEIKESIQTLKGQGPEDFVEHCLEIASHMLVVGQRAESTEEGRKLAQDALESGRGLEFLKQLVEAQGGDVAVIDHPERLPQAPIQSVIEAPHAGYVHEVNAREVGETAVLLGAGRSKKGEAIDPAVGISVRVKVGDRVEAGMPLFVVHARDDAALTQASQRLREAVRIKSEAHDPLPLFYGVISSA